MVRDMGPAPINGPENTWATAWGCSPMGAPCLHLDLAGVHGVEWSYNPIEWLKGNVHETE